MNAEPLQYAGLESDSKSTRKAKRQALKLAVDVELNVKSVDSRCENHQCRVYPSVSLFAIRSSLARPYRTSVSQAAFKLREFEDQLIQSVTSARSGAWLPRSIR